MVAENYFYVAQDEHDVILFGRDLCEGMIVLIENSIMRESGTGDSEWSRARAAEVNAWCEVTRLQVVPRDASPLVRFIGRYSDGTSRMREYDASYAWIVKRLSIAAPRSDSNHSTRGEEL